MEILYDVSIRDFNSLAINVSARQLVFLNQVSQLPELIELIHKNKKYLVLGGGSNVLFRNDFDGLLIINQLKGRQIAQQNTRSALIDVGAGENWHQLVRWTLKHRLYGLENLSLIPGCVGAAPIQNIGAYGVEFERAFESLKAIDLTCGKQIVFDHQQCQFGYRDSVFKAYPDRYLITSVRLNLSKSLSPVLDYSGIKEQLLENGIQFGTATGLQISDAICQLRESKLPSPEKIGNAGSFFKNPVIDVEQFNHLKKSYPDLSGYVVNNGYKLSAAWLIEQSGLKGYRDDDAGIYQQHALVLVNHGQASGADIWKLANQIIASVKQMFGISLEPEPRIIS